MKRLALLLAAILVLETPASVLAAENIEEAAEEALIEADTDDISVCSYDPTIIEEAPIIGGARINTVYAGWGTKAMLAEADEKAQQLVAELTTDSMSDIEKAFVLAKYMNENVTYGVAEGYEKYYGQTAYEALIVGESVCAGNAAAYNMLTYYAGLDTIYITSSKAKHAWDEILLDGKWYYVDAQNAQCYDTFFMAADSCADGSYNYGDAETYEDFAHNPYDYLHDPQECSSTLYEGIKYTTLVPVEGKTGYYTYALDWDTFKKNLTTAGIDYEKVVSGEKLISKSLSGLKVTLSADEIELGENIRDYLTVVPVFECTYESGNSRKTEGSPVTDYTVEGSLVNGSSSFTISYTYEGVTKTTTVKVTGVGPAAASVELLQKEVSCTNGTVYVPETKDQAILTDTEGTEYTVDVKWDEAYRTAYDPEETGEQSFILTGEAVLPDSVSNRNNISLTVTREVTILATDRVLTIKNSVDSGSYYKSFQVTLSTEEEGSSIYYDLDQSGYKFYDGPVSIIGQENSIVTHTLKVKATKKGYLDTEEEYNYELVIGESDSGVADLQTVLHLVKGEKKNILENYSQYNNSKAIKENQITLSSTDGKVAAVSKKGIVTGKKAGTATVTIYRAGQQIGCFEVIVDLPSFSAKKYTIIKGDSMEIAIANTSISSDEISYSIPEKAENYAYFGNGILVGKAKGSVKITALIHGKRYTTTVKVEEPKISKSEILLKAGKSKSLKLSGCSRKDVTWTSSDEEVATVVNGRVTAIGSGEAEITAAVDDHTYTCYVTVE